MAIQYDKPFLDYEKMINLMISRGIQVSDRSFAKRALSSLSYYTLVNGYKDTFLSVNGTDSFIEGTTFEQLYTLYQIDNSINAILLKYILRVEIALKSRISYAVAESFGVYTDINDLTNINTNDYLCRNHYSSSSHKRNNTLVKIKKRATASDASDSVKYYITNHNHVPPWILTTTLSFGNCIFWYEVLSKKQKDHVANEFINDTYNIDDKKAFLTKCLRLLRFFRNHIAHGHKMLNLTWNDVLPQKAYLDLSHSLINTNDLNNNIYTQKGLFAVVVILLLINDTYGKRLFASELLGAINPYIERNVTIAGKSILDIFHLPNDIFNRILNYLSTT